jgi:quinol monooxygenase YgiN
MILLEMGLSFVSPLISQYSGHIPMKPFVFVVYLHIKPDRQDDFLRLLTPLLDAMRYEETFINTVLHQDPHDTTRFMLYETWANREEFFEVQIQRPYRLDYEAKLPDLLEEPRQAELWQPMRGDFKFHSSG